MRKGPTFGGLLAQVDRILEIRDFNPGTADLAPPLARSLDGVLVNAGFDPERRRHLDELTTELKQSAARLSQSTINLKRGGRFRGDWLRFASYDFAKFKDMVLALREFLVANRNFIEFACSRARRGRDRVDFEKLFDELREIGAISERTWVLLMSRVGDWRTPSDGTTTEQLERISNLLFDLREARSIRALPLKTGDGDEARRA